MKAEVLANFQWMYLPVFALILFLALFIGVIFWILRRDSKQVYSEASQLPLNEGGTR